MGYEKRIRQSLSQLRERLPHVLPKAKAQVSNKLHLYRRLISPLATPDTTKCRINALLKLYPAAVCEMPTDEIKVKTQYNTKINKINFR